MARIDRRSFLKLASLSSSLLLAPQAAAWAQKNIHAQSEHPNIIVLVFDAMSARNLSLYGYPRATSPNLQRFAERATVYHSHYSGGNFTTAGVSSLLTGTYPWTHRAINFRGLIKRELIGNDIFTMLGNEYTRLAFPQNFWVNLILTQLKDSIDILLPTSAFSELDYLVSDYFTKDENMAARGLDDFVFKLGGQPVPLVLGSLERWLYEAQTESLSKAGYANGIPHAFDYPLNFRLEKVFAGLAQTLTDLQNPFFAYLHLLPPHAPYTPNDKFNNTFKDSLKFPKKPEHPLSDQLPNGELLRARRMYDEYIATTDEAFGKFLDFMEHSGLLENSYVFITSDHGEMFERGEAAHSTPLLYDPVVHIPLIVSAPQQKTRRDIYSPTSAVDILPTIAELTRSGLPALHAGRILPGVVNSAEDAERSIYIVEAKLNPANQALKQATIVLRKGNQKLIYYTGYDQEDVFELYDLENDIEEMKNLFPQKSAGTIRMKDELLEALYNANKPYLKS